MTAAGFLSFLSLLNALFVSRLVGDTPPPPVAYVATNAYGSEYFKMVPRPSGEQGNRFDGFGIAYRVARDGSDQEIWRSEGWYSFQVFLSDDGHCLVAMGPWNVGSKPSRDDLALAFYRDGKLLKKYSTAELVKDASKVVVTASHYFWLARDAERFSDKAGTDPGAGPRLVWPGKFRLKTCDGILYEFELETGEITKTRK